jgi:uncharacterized Zn-binding protein involved in type VI secretion
MLPITRVTDVAVGICFGHGVPIPVIGIVAPPGSPNTTANGLPVGRTTDSVAFTCGHTGIITSGNPSVSVNSLPAGQITSPVTGLMVAIVITGSPNVG